MKYELKEKTLYIDIDSLFQDTIQSFFDEYIPSKKFQHLLIQNKWILIDDKPVKREDKLEGNKLSILIYPNNHQYEKVKFEPDVVYEDEIIVVVNKPKGVLVHSDGNEELTLTDWVKSYYAETPWIDVQPIHRLDKETTGLVMFSKSEIFQPLLDKLMFDNQIRRSYLAFVKGKIPEGKQYTIDKPIGKDRHDSKKRVVAKVGQPALTKARSVGNYNGISILRCTLDTGRTHQIRVHLASIGYPIINDELYGIRDKNLVRMGLIGDELDFYHPLKEEMMNVECDLPNDMARFMNEVLR